jgi:hypothetical protein
LETIPTISSSYNEIIYLWDNISGQDLYDEIPEDWLLENTEGDSDLAFYHRFSKVIEKQYGFFRDLMDTIKKRIRLYRPSNRIIGIIFIIIGVCFFVSIKNNIREIPRKSAIVDFCQYVTELEKIQDSPIQQKIVNFSGSQKYCNDISKISEIINLYGSNSHKTSLEFKDIILLNLIGITLAIGIIYFFYKENNMAKEILKYLK